MGKGKSEAFSSGKLEKSYIRGRKMEKTLRNERKVKILNSNVDKINEKARAIRAKIRQFKEEIAGSRTLQDSSDDECVEIKKEKKDVEVIDISSDNEYQAESVIVKHEDHTYAKLNNVKVEAKDKVSEDSTLPNMIAAALPDEAATMPSTSSEMVEDYLNPINDLPIFDFRDGQLVHLDPAPTCHPTFSLIGEFNMNEDMDLEDILKDLDNEIN